MAMFHGPAMFGYKELDFASRGEISAKGQPKPAGWLMSSFIDLGFDNWHLEVLCLIGNCMCMATYLAIQVQPIAKEVSCITGSPVLSDAGFNLLNKLLTYDPKQRITAEEALNHECLREVPLPKSKEFMPTFPTQHAQDRRVRDQRRKEIQQGEVGTGGLFGQ